MRLVTELPGPLAEAEKAFRQILAMLAGQGVFDVKHFDRLTNPNLPIWAAMLWISFDILVAPIFRSRRIAGMPACAACQCLAAQGA